MAQAKKKAAVKGVANKPARTSSPKIQWIEVAKGVMYRNAPLSGLIEGLKLMDKYAPQLREGFMELHELTDERFNPEIFIATKGKKKYVCVVTDISAVSTLGDKKLTLIIRPGSIDIRFVFFDNNKSRESSALEYAKGTRNFKGPDRVKNAWEHLFDAHKLNLPHDLPTRLGIIDGQNNKFKKSLATPEI